MAYYNGFPATYQNPYQVQQYQYSQVAQQVQNSGITWIQGEAGAKSYLVAPNTTVPLWDSEAQVIYLKSADSSGMPSMKILDYTVRDSTSAKVPVQTAGEEYVTRQEFSDFVSRVENHFEEVKNGKSTLQSDGKK